MKDGHEQNSQARLAEAAASAQSVARFLKESSIPHLLPSDPEFDQQKVVALVTSATPLVIARPATPDQVAQIVRYCAGGAGAGGIIPFTVRSGGHDLRRRSTVDGALQIDVRDLNHVRLAADGKTARIGGGISAQGLLEALEKVGRTAPAANAGSVGHVGWSTLGGYSQYSSDYGLGVDQILGATVVDAKGELVEVGDRVLKALKGGGAANFGVVVELNIQVYQHRPILSGALIYESSNIANTTTEVLSNLQALIDTEPLPPHLYILPTVANVPGVGKVMIVNFTWNGPAETYEEGNGWVTKTAALGHCIQQDIPTTTPLEVVKQLSGIFPAGMYGTIHTTSLSQYSDEAIAAIAKAAEAMPEGIPSTCLLIHSLGASSPSCRREGDEDVDHDHHDPARGSVFRCREPHLQVEIIGASTNEEVAGRASAWADATRAAVAGSGLAVLESVYPALCGDDDTSLESKFGENLEYLLAVKKEFDPEGLFKHGNPRLLS